MMLKHKARSLRSLEGICMKTTPQQPGSSRVKIVIKSVGTAFGYGMLAALGLGLFVFLFGTLTSGGNIEVGSDWTRRVLYVVSSLAIIAAGAGMLFSGREYAEKQRGFTKDIAARETHITDDGKIDSRIKDLAPAGIQWATAILVAAAGSFFVAALYDEIMGRFFLL